MPGRLQMPAATPFQRLRSVAILSALALALLTGCEDVEAPKAAPAVDRMARRYLETLASHDLDSIHRPLDEEGKRLVTPLSLAKIYGYLESGPPTEVTLLAAEIADRATATPAERHRLTYRLDFPDKQSYYYFFELVIDSGDSLVTGFQIEPRDENLAR